MPHQMRDSDGHLRPAPMRRLFVLALVFVAAILSCGKDVTGPLGAAGRYVRGLAFNPVFPPAFQAAGGSSSGIVQFSKVHVVLRHTDGSVALDTTIDFPAGADSLTVDLTVKLLDNAPATGEPMTLNLGYVNAAGDTVFKGGPVSLTAAPPSAAGTPAPPVQVPVSYTGPGSTATTVVISPRSESVLAGSPFSFSAVAKDQNGVVLAGTPIIWNSLDPSVATLTTAAAGNGTAQSLRGTARIIAQLFSGAADTAFLDVVLPASQIILQSGNAQTGIVGTTLAQPLVVKVAAADGVGVQGITVNFAVTSGGGSVANASVVSDGNGLAQTTFKLGTGTGSQTVMASAGGMNNSPITFTATAQAATASKLIVTTQPSNGVAGTALSSVVVTAEDNNGNIATAFTGPVVIALGNNPSGATLGGTLTVNAVAGVATFSTLTINGNGAAYTLVASSTGLASATTSAFDVTVGAPSKLLFSVQPSGGVVNQAMTPAIVVNAQDSQGNPTPAFTGSVTLSLAANTTSATLGGTVTVNAVAGVATFPGISVSATGNGYTLTAASTGLTSATSAPFNVGGGSATSMLVVSGGGQTGPTGAALAAPIVIQVNDAGGAGIAGSIVNFAVVTGGGSVLPVSGVTNGAGQVQTTWTLGPALGPQSISATSAGLIGSPLTISATAVVGAVTQLVITQQPSNAVAGVAIAPAITVTAKDAGNNVVTTFTSNVSLAFGANPGGATLGGTATVAAVNGVATFNSVSLNKAGVGYTLVASSGAITSAASSAFNITAAAASAMAITAGQSQSGNTLTPLATPLAVTVTDAFGNPVSGTTVNWASSGGATMSPTSSGTNASGIATSSWTLGSTPGAQTATATSGTLTGSPATFNATATLAGFSKTWTGATSTAWTTATNWTPSGVPVAGDSVFIPSGGNQPTISAATTVKHLTVGFGATLTFAATPTLTVTGNFTDNGSVAGPGLVDLNGAGTVAGSVGQAATVSGTYAATNTVTATSSLSASGSFTLGGHTVTVGGTFGTTGAGTITMTNAADVLTVAGDITFAGGSETGKITAGTINAAGNFTQSTNSTAFIATGTNTVLLQAAAPRTVTFANVPASAFANLTTSNTAGVTFASNVYAGGNMTVAAGTVTGAGFTLAVGGTLTDPSTAIAVSNMLFVGGAAPVSATTPVINANVSFQGNPSALSANLTVNGSATVSSSGQLGFGGHTLTVNGAFSTASSGTISMSAALDALVVNGNVTFSGGNSSGLLTNGTLTFTGNFAQTNTGGGAEFSPAGSHTTIMSGGNAQSITFATPDTANGSPCSGAVSCFGALNISKSGGAVTFATPTHVQGNLTANAGVTVITQTSGTGGTPSLITVRGNLTTTATTAPVTFTRLATKGTPSLGASTVLDTVIFAGTGAQAIPAGTYNTVYVNGAPTVGGNFTTTGNLTIFSNGGLSGSGKVITIGGSLFTQSGGVLSMAPGDTITVAGNASFNGGASLLTGGLLQIGGNFSQGTATNSFPASSPHATRFIGATPTISFANPATSFFGTLQLATSGAVNFTTDVTTSSDIWLKTGTTPSVTNAGGTVNAGRAIFDTTGGRWQVANTVMTSGSGGTLPRRVTTNLSFTNGVVLLDSLKVTGNVTVTGASAQLDLNGHYMSVTGSFGTASSGLLRMVHTNDSLVVKGNASFNGGSTTGLLTFGYFEFDGANFSQGTTASAFSADTPHQTFFGGTTQQGILFANPGSAGASHFGNLYLADTATVLASNINLNGQLQTGGAAASFHIESAVDHLVTSNGANLHNVVFDNVRWSTVGTTGAGLFPSIANVTFQNISQTILPQFDYEYSTTTNLALSGFTFLTTPTGGGSYISVVGPDTLTMSGVTPSQNGGFLSLTGGGMVLGWTGSASQLKFTAQPSNAVAGVPISPAIVVTAKDVANNVATSFTGNVTLGFGANPGGATLSGTTTVAAVAGVATFNGISLNKAATGYTLNATSGTLTAGTSSTFNITAAAASTMTISGGQGQTGITSTALATPLAVTVTDASGNPVSGVTVNWASSGGATMSPTSSGTNASGIATSSWTLGSTPGAQTATATSGTLTGSPATFNATGTLAGFSKTWTGTTSTAWTTATNWTPSGVPVAGDSVFIPSGGNQPTISAATTVKHLTVGFGATLTFAAAPTLTVTGNFIDNGTTAGAGTIDLNGTGNVLGPILQTVTVSGIYSATGTVTVTNSLSVTGSFTLAGHAVSISGTFATSGSGTVTMTNAADALTITGNATFGGGNETGLLTAGTLALAGNFTQATSPTAFVATSPHVTTLTGTLAQTLSFANPAAASSHFGNLLLTDTATVLASNVYLTGQLQVGGAAASFHIEAAADHLVTSNGANVHNVVFDNVRWSTVGTSGAGQFPLIAAVTFQNISQTTLPQFDFEYSTTTNLGLSGFTFLTTPTGGGSYISVVGPDTLTMSGVTPSQNGGFLSLTGGGMVLGWTGTASQLIVTTQPTNAVAGVNISPAIVVTAKDVANNTATSFTGNVTLAFGANPGGATLSGTTTVAAVAGVATFNSISLNKAATGYTLVASSGALTAGTSGTFNITAAAASTMTISGGQGQTGITSTALATPLAVTVTDAFGNPVSGTTVNWASSGGATMSPTSSGTNASGIATSSWTLGSTPGAQTATATSGTLTGSPATFNATATLAGFSKTWTGTTSTAWTTATNWTPSGVPVAGDSVFIPSGGNQPTISAATTVKHLTVGFGATLTFAATPTLTVTGNFIDNGATAGAGTIDLNGTGNVLGPIAQTATVSGTYTATGTVTMAGTLSVSGSLTLGGHAVSVASTFATTGSGTVTMANAADVLTITGNATFGGGSENGLLTAGNMALSGNFAQINGSNSFVGSSGHTTAFVGTVAQTINFANVFPSAFGAVTFTNTAGVTFQTGVVANGAVTIGSGAVNGGTNSISINGTLTDPGSHLAVAGIAFGGGTPAISATTPSITVTTGSVTFNAAAALAANLTINGAVNVNSASGTLAPNGHTLTINGNLGTANSGSLVMNAAGDVIIVNGSATFAGGPGTMTNGSLQITGNFAQTTSTNAFVASSAHVTTFNGTTAQTINFANPGPSAFGAVSFTNTAGVTIQTQAAVNGAFTVGSGAVTSTNSISINGTLTDPTSHLSVASIAFGGGSPQVSSTTPSITVTVGAVTFNAAATLAGNLTINGPVNVNSAAGVLAPNGHTLTINGDLVTVSSGTIAMSNVSDLLIVNGNATFSGGAGVLTNGVLQVSGNFTQNTAATAFAASSPHITRLTGSTPTISFANPTTSNFGTLQLQTTGAVTFATNAATSFDIWLKTGTTPSVTGTGTVTAGRAIYDTTGGRWQVANTTMSGNGALPKFITTNLTFTSALLLTDSIHVTGNVLSKGAGASLDLNGFKMIVSGSFGTSASGVFKMTHVTDSLIVNGNASFNGGSTAGLLTNGLFEFNGTSFAQDTNTQAFAASSPHVTYFWGSLAQNINFANPAAASSHFGILYLGDTATVLASDVVATGQFQTGIVSQHRVGSTGADHLLTSDGANMRNTAFDNVRWKVAGTNGNGSFPSIDNVSFQNISNTAAAQFDFEYSVTTNLTLAGFNFLTTPTTGSYIKVVGPDTLTMSGVTPVVNGGFLSLSGAGAVNGWSNSTMWTGGASSTAWNTPANWNTGVVPTLASDVVINPGIYQPNTGGAVSMHNLTVSAGATLTLSGVSGNNMTVYGDITVAAGGQINMANPNVAVLANGNVTTDTAGTTGFTGCGGQYLSLQAGVHTVTGKFCNVGNFGTYTASGPIVVPSGVWQNYAGGNLALNGHRMDVNFFANSGSGVITMTNANDSLFIHGGTANFSGGSETGLMTAGTIIDRASNFTVTGTGLDATFGSQTLVVDTTLFQTLTWNSMVPGHGFNNVLMKGTASKGFSGDQYITGTLQLDTSMVGPGTVSGSYNIHVANLVDNSFIAGGGFAGSSMSLHITGNGTFNRDTVSVNTLTFEGGGNFSLSHNLITNYVVVDSGSGLILNGHRLDLQGNYFTTQNGGVLGMTAAGDSLIANQLYFNGGNEVGALTRGGINVTGSVFGVLYQGYSAGHVAVPSASATSFAPSGTRVWFNAPSGTNVAFANPGSGATGSHLWSAQATNGNPITVMSNIVVDSILQGEVSGDTWQSDSAATGVIRTITTKGIYNAGTFGLALKGVAIVLNDGPAASTFFNSVTWTNFPTISSGALFTQNRTSSPPQVNFQTYTGVSFTGTGNFAFNAGSATLTLGSSITPSGSCTSAILTTGTGCH